MCNLAMAKHSVIYGTQCVYFEFCSTGLLKKFIDMQKTWQYNLSCKKKNTTFKPYKDNTNTKYVLDENCSLKTVH